ncbi:MAG: cytochrome c [Sedimenticola sp.]|nr:cytochrome c [Sedimenticola sp.]
MKRTGLWGLLWLASLAANGETGQPPDPASVAAGERLYSQHCVACHGERGAGEAPIPPTIRAPGYLAAMPLDETSHAWHHSDEQLVETIMEGLRRTDRMPPRKGLLSQAEARQLVAYIKSLWSPRIIACQGPAHMRCM